jgi:hypothetical protein
MSYLLIQNFQAGLDTRKSAFTAPPGSLRKARNVHLTRGAEIEVRKKFVPVYSLPPGKTKGCTTVKGQLYVFGSDANVAMPAGVMYQRLVAPYGPALMRILSTDNFNGKIYVVAQFNDGMIYHFYDGVRVTDWDAIANTVGSKQTLAENLAREIDVLEDVSALALDVQVVVTAAVPGVPFTYSTSTLNGGAVADQTLAAVLSQANVPAVQPAYATGSFRVTGGSAVPAGAITSVSVGGTPLLLDGPVPWQTSNAATAQAVAAAINVNAMTADYLASVEGDKVVLIAQAAGTVANGKVVAVGVSGSAAVGSIVSMAGGVNGAAAIAQVVTLTVGGTYEALDLFQVAINGHVINVRGAASGTGTFVRTLGQKMYATNQSLLHFSGFKGDPPVADPTAWDSANAGAGFINMSTQDGGSSQLTGLATYQNRLAVFSRRNVQLWSVDADEAQNRQDQVLFNIGTKAPRSIAAFGDIDVFFLSESGIRSLRARDSSNSATADDVGSAIDGELLSYQRGLSEELVAQAVGVSEPFEGRYLLAIGPTIYVFSHFPGAKVSAWTTYEIEEMGAGAVVSDWAVTYTHLVARIGDKLCLYGGQTGDQYDVAGGFEYEVELPFLDAQVPTAQKTINGLDLGTEGSWDVYLSLDSEQPEVQELVAKVDGATYGARGRCAATGMSTHFSLTLKGRSNGYARLANLAVHFTTHESS